MAPVTDRTETVEQKRLLLNDNKSLASHQARPGLIGIWDHRNLIAMMVRRDSLGKYKGSLLGVLWPMINPIGHLILYTFLFCIILKVKLGGDGSTSNFALYLMAGLLPWGAFAEALSNSSTCILEHPNYVKRVIFSATSFAGNHRALIPSHRSDGLHHPCCRSGVVHAPTSMQHCSICRSSAFLNCY